MHPRIAERAKEPRYTFPEAAAFLGRPTSTVRRWSVGNVRKQGERVKRDDPLIQIDGKSSLPLSFLNLLELRFLGSYRQKMPLQSIRRALEFAAHELGKPRPLLSVEFKVQGKSLFLEFAEKSSDRYLVDASRKGQLAWHFAPEEIWPSALEAFLQSVDYDEQERSAYRWWPLGRVAPVIIDTRVNGGRPSTARSGVRTNAIAFHRKDGLIVPEIAADVGATEAEVRTALSFERVAA